MKVEVSLGEAIDKLSILHLKIKKISDENKKRIILNQFKLKFPEYLDFYTQQCLNYYQGLTRYPNGNPTMKCPDLMKLDNAKTLLGVDKVNTFFNTTKL